MGNDSEISLKGASVVIIVVMTMIFIGLYFLPFGNDVAIYWIMANWTNGDYWEAQRIMYVICAVLIFSAIISGMFFGVKYSFLRNKWSKGKNYGGKRGGYK